MRSFKIYDKMTYFVSGTCFVGMSVEFRNKNRIERSITI